MEADIGKLFGLFCIIDGDSSGSIEIIELLMFLDVERTRFTKRIFSMFDDDASGCIDFREFVLSICK
jgi:Ca2+-binding EF-hand superfamily protein